MLVDRRREASDHTEEGESVTDTAIMYTLARNIVQQS